MNTKTIVLLSIMCLVLNASPHAQPAMSGPSRPRVAIDGVDRPDLDTDLISMAYSDAEHRIELVLNNWGTVGGGVGYKYPAEKLPLGTAVSVSIGDTKLFEGKLTTRAGDFYDSKPATLTLAATGNAAGKTSHQMTLTQGRELRSLHAVQKAGAKEIACEGRTEGNPKLAAGTTITVSGVCSPFAGSYTVTATRHIFNQTSGYYVEFNAQSAAAPPEPTSPPQVRPPSTRRIRA